MIITMIKMIAIITIIVIIITIIFIILIITTLNPGTWPRNLGFQDSTGGARAAMATKYEHQSFFALSSFEGS